MSNENITSTQVLLPVIMVSVVVFLFLAFQTVILSQDRVNFDTAITQQQPMIEQVQKVKSQLDALALGTLKLSQLGDKDAINIIAELKKAGVNVGDPSSSTPNASAAGPMGGMMPPMNTASPSPSTPMTSAPPGMQHMLTMPAMAPATAPAVAPRSAAPPK